MKRFGKPLLVAVALYAGYLTFVFGSAGHLPDPIATHFGAAGVPDSWMSRSGYLRFALLFGVLFPLLFPAICLFLRLLPNDAFNLPRRDYWLAPERRASTLDDFLRRSLWLACLSIAFIGGTHFLVLRANKQSPPMLSSLDVALIAGSYAMLILVGIIFLLRHYTREDALDPT